MEEKINVDSIEKRIKKKKTTYMGINAHGKRHVNAFYRKIEIKTFYGGKIGKKIT